MYYGIQVFLFDNTWITKAIFARNIYLLNKFLKNHQQYKSN